MFEKFSPGSEDEKLIAEIKKDRSRMKLTKPVECRPATPEDLEDILLIVRQARNYLRKNRVDQWQGEYPDAAAFEKDFQYGECYCMTYGGRVAGFFTLSARPEPTYINLTDGKWASDEPYCVLHRSAISAEFRGTGLSDKLIGFVEELTLAMGRSYVRVDTHRKNRAMRSLLTRHGYRFRGNILIESEPGHDPARQAFDKKLDKTDKK